MLHNASQSHCVALWNAGVQSLHNATQAAINAYSVQCNARLGLQSLILSKHVMFGQQPTSINPNILNHNLREYILDLRIFAEQHDVARISSTVQNEDSHFKQH